MKALVYHGPREVSVQEVPDAKLEKPIDVLVKITTTNICDIEVHFVGEPDFEFNPMGARGMGAIGITGTAAAVANAVFLATGKRVRDLPITLDKLLS